MIQAYRILYIGSCCCYLCCNRRRCLVYKTRASMAHIAGLYAMQINDHHTASARRLHMLHAHMCWETTIFFCVWNELCYFRVQMHFYIHTIALYSNVRNKCHRIPSIGIAVRGIYQLTLNNCLDRWYIYFIIQKI